MKITTLVKHDTIMALLEDHIAKELGFPVTVFKIENSSDGSINNLREDTIQAKVHFEKTIL